MLPMHKPHKLGLHAKSDRGLNRINMVENIFGEIV